MERFTISIDDELAHEFDRLREETDARSHCVANLSYVFNHHERDLAERLTTLQHAHHDLTVSTMHAHLDHEHCIESVILKGRASEVRRFADAMTAQRGVHHGQLNLVTVELDPSASHSHVHLKPRH